MKNSRDVFVFLLFALGIYLFLFVELVVFVRLCKDGLFSSLRLKDFSLLALTTFYNPIASVSCWPYWIVYFLRGKMTLKHFLFWCVAVNGVLLLFWSLMVSCFTII